MDILSLKNRNIKYFNSPQHWCNLIELNYMKTTTDENQTESNSRVNSYVGE